MNLAIRLTLDGLVRALTRNVCDLAEPAQQRYPSQGDNAARTVYSRSERERGELGKDCHDSRGC